MGPERREGLIFEGRKVLVTGAARGIGLEVSRGLIRRGAAVLAVGRDVEALARLAEVYPARISPLTADLGQPEGVERVVAWVRDSHPDLAVLINNAAIMRHGLLTGGEVAGEIAQEIAQEIAINLTAPLRLSAALLPGIARQKGAVVNVTSGLAIAPRARAAVYCATKAGLRSFTRSLRDQCRIAGLTVQVSEVVMTLVDTTLSTPGIPNKYPPQRAAEDLLRGLEAGKDEVWIERTRALRLIHRLWPAVAYRILRGQ